MAVTDRVQLRRTGEDRAKLCRLIWERQTCAVLLAPRALLALQMTTAEYTKQEQAWQERCSLPCSQVPMSFFPGAYESAASAGEASVLPLPSANEVACGGEEGSELLPGRGAMGLLPPQRTCYHAAGGWERGWHFSRLRG